MKIKQGDTVRCDLDGEDYTIRRIMDSKVILQLSDPRKQTVMVAGIDFLEGYFKKKEDPKLYLVKMSR